MKARLCSLALVAALGSSLPAYAGGSGGPDNGSPGTNLTIPIVNDPSAASTSGATATANPTITASPKAYGGEGGSATANPVVSPVISPTITGGNGEATIGDVAGGSARIGDVTSGSTAKIGDVTAGGANLKDVGNAAATLNGSVSGVNNLTGTNTLNGNVNGSNTNNNNIGPVTATGGSNTNTLNGGSVVDNSKTTNTLNGGSNTLVGGNTSATGTANVNLTSNPTATGGQGGAGGSAKQDQNQQQQMQQQQNATGGSVNGSGNSSSKSESAATGGSVKDSGNSNSVSKVDNSGNSTAASAATGGTVKNSGNVRGSGNSAVNIQYNNPKPLPPAPGVVVPNATAPQLFHQVGLPANAQGLELAVRFMRACPSTYTKGQQMREIREKGNSGLTRLIFTPHSNYAKLGSGKDVLESALMEVPADAKVGEFRYLCLGLIQSEALAKHASDVPIQTVINDAVGFAGDELKGFDEVLLVYIPKESLSVNMGVNGDANGWGISPGGAGMLGQLLTTLAGGFSVNSGNTFPVAQLGGTFLVVAKGSFPESAPFIDFAPPTPVVSEADKALEVKLAAAEAAQAAALQEAQAAKAEAEALKIEGARNLAKLEQQALAADKSTIVPATMGPVPHKAFPKPRAHKKAHAVSHNPPCERTVNIRLQCSKK